MKKTELIEAVKADNLYDFLSAYYENDITKNDMLNIAKELCYTAHRLAHYFPKRAATFNEMLIENLDDAFDDDEDEIE